MSYQMSERVRKNAFKILSKGRVSLVVSGCLLTTTVSLAAPVGEEKWGAHIDIEGKGGTDRNLGEAGLFMPLWQDVRTLVFTDIRTRMDDQSSREGNFGLGVRHMLESGWNVGTYAYWDRRRSEYDNFFNQVTVGAEALSLDWDFRVNGYVPVGQTTYNEDSLNRTEISGSNVIFRGGEERSLGGFDAEIGWRVPLFAADADQQLRVYAGGYRFADKGVPMVAGPRGRAEMVFDELPGLWSGSRLWVGAELQNDDPRGTQGFLSMRLSIPLQAAETKSKRLTPMERRMTDSIVRDIDVVSQAGTFGAAETAQATNGSAITVLNSATTVNLATAITNAGANSTVILSGSFTPANNTILTLNSGQTVMGSGSLSVRSPSGRTATLTQSSGATVTTTFTTNNGIVAMADNSTLSGVTLNQYGSGAMAPFGIYADGKTGVTIADNTIYVQHNMAAAYGIYLANGTSATISGNAISVHNLNAGGASARGIRLADSSSAKITNNTISAVSDTGGAFMSPVFITNSGIYQSGSTGNTFSTSGGCNINSGGTTGTLYYTDSNGVSQSCP
ncbi:MAG: inverse autotransporter beta domain-containing protein [Sulfuricurvum sp.]|uniref:inverse autotransporter beta domain-containing protein n=1 Tax=Sulfuricurvum sp. TaxID=2025608 RepID=UPI0027235E34|nr:inverse autotransporter beta domain-containing protein [Sulfuricurvum sp.]MDO9055677.1 inverse autotransporter beta domain-containing protein [Sulfuricurvum sp.]